MKIIKSLALFVAFLFFSVTPIFAGGGLVMLDVNPHTSLHPGEWFKVSATVYTDNTYATRCQQCTITFKFQDPYYTDKIEPAQTTTDSNGQASSKMTSYLLGDRLVYVDVVMPDGSTYTSSQHILSYNKSYIQMDMVYPVDGQTLDLEGAYMFKIKPVTGANGYLFGLFQDGKMIYENYRDSGILSGNGEFALWESSPYHAKFHEGPVKVMIRAYMNGQWTDAKEITINLKSRAGAVASTLPVPSTKPVSTPSASTYPVPSIKPTTPVIVDSTASAELQRKVEELQQKLEESQKKQSVLEERLNALVSWIKSVFPFFGQ